MQRSEILNPALLCCVLFAAACNGEPPTFPLSSTQDAVSAPPGALVKLEMRSRVGVLLDEIPASLRDQAAGDALDEPSSFWIERAARQVRLANYRLVFRGDFYSDPKGPLPLPDRSVWDIKLKGSPQRKKIGGHDLVLVDYTFSTHLLTDADSPGAVEPALATTGGIWDEDLIFPADPELILERTGYACMDEAEYPIPSVFEENTFYFYDQTCDVEAPGAEACHLSHMPAESCATALQAHVGAVPAKIRFKRVKYKKKIADKVRVGVITNPDGADLAVVQSDMVEQRSLLYRFFEPGACELEEGVIGSLGWRRILTFSATVRNDGTGPIHIGDLTDPSNPWLSSHGFEFSACHNHYHFSHYGVFGYGGAPGAKRAFCLEETNRYHNDEHTPLTAPHQSCSYQGVQAGWGDEYQFGLPGQWVDVTGVDMSTPHDLVFNSNPDRFLCEGAPVLDADGNPIFDPSEFTTANGDVVGRIRCDMPAAWHANNVGTVSVSAAPGQSFVTSPCTRGQIGPLRDCGFAKHGSLRSCTPGQLVHLTCSAESPQVLRICERSQQLGVGVACALADSLANQVVTPAGKTVTFTCPAVRDAASAWTGGYSVYQSAVIDSESGDSITCTGW